MYYEVFVDEVLIILIKRNMYFSYKRRSRWNWMKKIKKDFCQSWGVGRNFYYCIFSLVVSIFVIFRLQHEFIYKHKKNSKDQRNVKEFWFPSLFSMGTVLKLWLKYHLLQFFLKCISYNNIFFYVLFQICMRKNKILINIKKEHQKYDWGVKHNTHFRENAGACDNDYQSVDK